MPLNSGAQVKMQNTKVKSDKVAEKASIGGILRFDFCILQFDLDARTGAGSNADTINPNAPMHKRGRLCYEQGISPWGGFRAGRFPILCRAKASFRACADQAA
jgi:hypothetical protein